MARGGEVEAREGYWEGEEKSATTKAGQLEFFCEANVASDDFNHAQCSKQVQVNCRAAADIADSASLSQLVRIVCQ